MKNFEFIATCDYLHINNSDALKCFGVTRKTFYNWRTGSNSIPHSACEALSALLSFRNSIYLSLCNLNDKQSQDRNGAVTPIFYYSDEQSFVDNFPTADNSNIDAAFYKPYLSAISQMITENYSPIVKL